MSCKCEEESFFYFFSVSWSSSLTKIKVVTKVFSLWQEQQVKHLRESCSSGAK